MFQEITAHINKFLNNFSNEDSIILNNRTYPVKTENFQPLKVETNQRTIAFIDGGQAEIIKAGNFCLSFIRVYGIVLQNNRKIADYKKEFYLFTRAVWHDDDLFYESKLFGDPIIDAEDLSISSNDSSIKTGQERAPITKVANMARRFAELSMVNNIQAEHILLDGTLEPTFRNEEKYLDKLPTNASALAKSSQLFTTSGNSPVILLNKLGPSGCWSYNLDENTKFVKLDEQAKHVFRFSGNTGILSDLITNSSDALFLGYPYGLLLVDRLARVSHAEKNSLKMRFLLNNRELAEYLNATNSHDILDNLG